MAEVSTVTQLVHSVKSTLESEFRAFSVQGEITNISKTVAGHIYFTLSDDQAQVSCAFFRGDVMRSSHMRRVQEGDKIIVQGHISVYAKRGVFQVIVKRVAPLGKGDLKAQFEKLKMKFAKLGYFDEEAKTPIPRFPKRIAVITAPYGAALQDFLNVMKRRCQSLDILIIPAIVQGNESAPSLVKAMEQAQKIKDIDVIVLTRGGGAMEDLWSFNDEKLVETIYACKVPVISAVGHQIDFTLSDFVSDLRAETPSAAAQLLSEHQANIIQALQTLGRRLKVILFEHRDYMQKKLERINPKNLLSLIRINFNQSQNRLSNLNFIDRAQSLVPIADGEQRLEDTFEKMHLFIDNKLKDLGQRNESAHKLLNSLNPNNVLNRGYSYVLDPKNKAIESKEIFAQSKDTEFEIVFKDGKQKVKKV